jgi:hypothetical protein
MLRVKMYGAITPYTYVFMAWCMITLRDNFLLLVFTPRPSARIFRVLPSFDSTAGGSTRAIWTRLSSTAMTLQDGALISFLYRCLHLNSFLQACRGTKIDSGVAVDEVDGYALSYVIPTQADVLIVYSTMEGTQRVVSRNEYKRESQRNTV